MLDLGVIKKNKVEALILLTLFTSAFTLRFVNLGYSNYTADEYGAMIWTKETQSHFPSDLREFFLTRKKGPLQYIISHIPIYFVGEYNNELALRIPFAIFSTLSVLIFYLFVKRITKNSLTGFFAALLLMTSGFVAAFGRIAQYQNLNLFFSLTALYLYSELLVSKKDLLRKTMFATLSLSLSFLSHWDAVYALIPLSIILIKFVRDGSFSKKVKYKILVSNLLLGLLLVLPFLIPYALNFSLVSTSQEYLARRVGFNLNSNALSYIFDINFYNPFLTIYVYVIGGLVGSLFIKKNQIFLIWFVTVFLVFETLIQKPGTHIYNFLLPLFVLVAIGFSQLIRAFPGYFRVIPILLATTISIFLYIQAYLIFVDHKTEYPWRQEEILWLKTPKRTHESRSRYLIGFPHNRYWKQINEFIREQNKINNEEFGFISNESKTISEYYVDAPYKTDGNFYAVGVKYPWSFVNDYKFPQIKNKETVKRIENKYGETVVQIFRVEN